MQHKLEKRLTELERKAPAPAQTRLVIYHVVSPRDRSVLQRLVYVPRGEPIEVSEAEEAALSKLSEVSTLSIPAMVDQIRCVGAIGGL